jgi:hypothetical protein
MPSSERLTPGDSFTIFVNGTSASATVEYAVITSVDFSGTSSDPTITVHGRGFGAAPAGAASSPPSSQGCPGATGYDYALDELEFLDLSSGWHAGRDNNCITVVLVSYSGSQVVFNFGSYYGQNGWVLDSGNSYLVGVAGSVKSGTY